VSKQSVTLGVVLRHECVGLEPIDDGVWHLWFGPVFLGRLQDLGRKEVTLKKNLPFKETKRERSREREVLPKLPD
jgi:hypothetical protein